MSTASTQSRGANRRVNSIQNEARHSRTISTSHRRPVSHNDAYTYALRAAYLHYLIQPRARRTQSVPAPTTSINRSSTSFNDLMKDFSLVRDSKSTRFPHGFIAELEKRITKILMGKERRKEYQDTVVKRTFAAFFNALTEQSFKKRMEKDRRVEDLVLIFFSNATKELSKGKEPDDDGWKLMVDRHVALFVRLITLILKEHEWDKDKPELANRLATLESKLLAHDQDLTQKNGGGKTIEVPVPLSYEVKDMPMVQTVARIFGLTDTQVQSDITRNRPIWTEKAALQDLKTYQTQLSLNTKKTLSRDDFKEEDVYENWKKAEGPDLSQMMLAIVQSNPDLAKTTSEGQIPQFSPHARENSMDSSLIEHSKKMADQVDQPLDLSSLSIDDDGANPSGDSGNVYTFIPPEPRSFYRFILSQTVAYDLKKQKLEKLEDTSDEQINFFSKQSTELLNEICLRWRIPNFSRAVLFLDVMKEKFVDQEIDLDALDSSFNLVKQPSVAGNKRSSFIASPLFERRKWTIPDTILMQRLLSSLHEALFRELYDVMMHCYDAKPRPIGPVMHILETHVHQDPDFLYNEAEFEQFRLYVHEGLEQRAKDTYQGFLDQEVPAEQEAWECYHVIQLGKAVMKLAQRIQKRYRKNPEIMGVNPLTILVACVLPMYAEDAKDMVVRIIQQAREKEEEIEVQDGFDLYKELAETRLIYADALPGQPFPFPLEELLSGFVWRWIRMMDEKIDGWVDQAVKQDQFRVRTDNPNAISTQDQRHSVSVIDIFRSFNQIIEQIVQLNWDDDLQYAKFMTALSKSIGKGLARYCEILEQKFTKEMDRLTPEQEAALNQSKQEKWMQMAKEAWNSKEKIEPFQFFPESFVKLNNVEHALHQLDKLEREVNVDGCADVIAKHTAPPSQRQKKISTYVFTIKIVEGEDLKACDMNGLSDPYVVLADEYQKRISKTRVIYSNLNPRWDDSVDITTRGPLNIIATVWDWDTLGDHDYVGRTSLKLDPSNFSDFLPRDYWLDLDTQGRILLRVSMEGERDDIQFYFGKAFRTLKRSEREMTRKITEKLFAYINHCLSRRALKALLSRGITMSSVSSYFNRNRPQSTAVAPSSSEIEGALDPLFTYFDDNFAIMNQTLTTEAMTMVMARLWKEVLATTESLLVPPLSDKPSHQRPLTQQEVDIVSRWLVLLLDFFNAVDEETGEANGVPMSILKSPKYHEIQSINFFYFETTENLIRTSERMASATASRQQANRSRLSAPPAVGAFGGNFMGIPSSRRAKSIMMSRNLGTMKKAKEDKRRDAQADPNDDMILRILRMRPEAAGYLRDRSRQKERLAAAAAADLIVKQSLMSGGGGRMAGTLEKK